MKNPIILLFFLLIAATAMAQTRQVTGTVIGDDDLPVLGATVQVQGTSIGVSTDMDGKYAIQVSPEDTLLFTFVGLQTVQELVGQRSVIDVLLSESANELDKIIITGYSTLKKSRSTSSTEVVDVSVIEGQPRSGLQESLQGNVAGVVVTSSTGQPGSTPNVRIRGIGTFEGAAPLYVIDGFQTRDASVISQLNPNDVKTIQVLKDAIGVAIYGSRAANGVIVITTKTGRTGKTTVNYTSSVGFSDPSTANRNKPLQTRELQELLVEGVLNAGLETDPAAALTFLTDNGFNPGVDTNWYDLITQKGLYQEHSVSISGGGEDMTYFLSGGYQNQQGTIIASSNERMNIRLNMAIKASDKFRLNPTISMSKNIQNVRPDGGAFANPVRSIYRIRPDISPVNDDGTYNFDFNNTHNPLAQAEQEIRRNITYRAIVGTGAEYDITDEFTAKSYIGINYGFRDNFLRRPQGFGDARELGDGFQDSDFLFTWNWRNIISYEKEWNNVHSVNAFVGYEVVRTRNKFTALNGENILNGFEDLANATVPVGASTSKGIAGNNAVFANADYSYDEKYLASLSVRNDGSSNFGPNNQRGTFIAAGLGWNIAKEEFMNDVSWVDDLKLRTSFGQVGNDNIPANQFISLFGGNDYNGNPGRFFSSFGDPNVQWETQNNFDIGVDYAFLNNRIQGSLNYYNQKNTDLLRDNFPISASNGDTTIPANIGAITNKGIEFSIKSRNIVSKLDGGLEWTTSLNWTANNNEVVELGNDNEAIRGATSILAIGEDVNTFYLPVYAGVDPANGNPLWYTDGTRSAVTSNYSEADQAIVGNATPDWTAGLRNTFTYKGFGFTTNFYMSYGASIYDTWSRFTNSDGSRRLSDTGNVNRGTYDRRWQQPGDVTDVPAFVYGNSSQSNATSSRFLFDGTFVRLRDIELSYSFQPQILDKIGAERLSVYVRGSNLLTWRKDDRLERDPEAGVDGRLDQEIPIPKTYLFGLNITL